MSSLVTTIKRNLKIIPVGLKMALSGLFLGVAVLFPYVWYLVFIGILVCVSLIFEARSLRQALLFGWVIWFIKSLVVLGFLLSVYPVTRFPIENTFYEVGLILATWVLGAFALSVGGILFTILVRGVQKFHTNRLLILGITPFFWLAGEVGGSLFYSLLTLGVGSQIQAYFSMGYVGYAVAMTPGYIGWAVVAGVYGLTVLGVLLVMLWYVAPNFYYRKIVLGVFCILGVIGWVVSNNAIVNKGDATIFTVDTVFESGGVTEDAAKTHRTTVLAEAVSEAQKYNPDYIVLPEDSRYLDSVYDGEDRRRAYALYRFLNSTSSAIIVDTAFTKLGAKTDAAVLRSFVFSSAQTPIMSDKKYLTPQGEYLPFITQQLVRATGNGNALKHPTLGNYMQGTLIAPKNYTGPLVLFCFESINPLAVRTLLRTQDKAPLFIAHPVSHAWFHSSLLLGHQLDTILRIQAVWNGVAIVGAGNQAIGKTYLPNGIFTINTEVAQGQGWVIRESQW